MVTAARVLITVALLCISILTAQAIDYTDDEVVAVFPKNFPPEYSLSAEGKPYGYAIEVMQEVERRAGLNIKYVPVENWTTVWEMIDSGKADIVPNMGVTSEREQRLFFLQSYDSFSIVTFVRKEEKRIKSYSDLVGKSVGTTTTNVANSLANELELIQFLDASQSIQALINKKIDAAILPDAVVHQLASSLSLSEKIKPVGKPLKVINRAVAINRTRPDLYKLLDGVMDEYMESDEFSDTQESWNQTPKRKISIQQLVNINAALLLLVSIGVGVVIRYRKSKGVQTVIEKRLATRIISLAVVLLMATILTTVAAIWLLYDTALDGQKSRLVNIAQSRARMIENIARFDLSNRAKLGLAVEQSNAATISQVRATHHDMRGFGQTGEFTFARRSGDQIDFILRQRHSITLLPQDISWQAPEAEPMRRALSGFSGTLIGLDYRGVEVLAAHEPVAVLNAGIVAKIDLTEIREPYIRSALVALIITLAVLFVGIVLFVYLASPILNTLSHAYARLRAIVDLSPNLFVITDRHGKLILYSEELIHLGGSLPETGEFQLLREDGTLQTYTTSTFPLSVNNHDLGLCQISTNITEHVEIELELRKYEMAFNNAGEGMIVTDLSGKILKVNKAFESITGYTEHEVFGKNPRILQSNLHGSDFYNHMWLTLISEGEWKGEIWNRRKNGEAYPEWLSISTIYEHSLKPSHYIAVFSDITTLKRSQDKLYHLAYHDPLTNLPNRLLFRDRLEHYIKQAHRNNKLLTLFAIDLDRFKVINDSFGHHVGDLVLKQVAAQLQSLIRESDTVARMGGDEFTVIAYGFEDIQSICILAAKVVNGMRKNLAIQDKKIVSSISLGIAVYPSDGINYEELLKNADSALYRAKEKGRNNYQFYTMELGKSAEDKVILENQLLQGLEKREFVVYYQPQFEMSTKKLVGVEALVRWQHPKYGLITPDKFISLMEENGLIIQLGEWVLETACTQARDWLNSGHDVGRMSVNLSGVQLQRSDLLHTVQTILQAVSLPADKLELEVTEGFIMEEVKQSIDLLESLNNLGVSIAIDDFGTGYSSLAYLKKLPVNTLKIDRSFVHDLPNDEDFAIAKAVIALGHSLGMSVIAEGVEKDEQWQLLNKQGCDRAQGYLMGKPVSSEVFVQEHLQR